MVEDVVVFALTLLDMKINSITMKIAINFFKTSLPFGKWVLILQCSPSSQSADKAYSR